jgi:3-methyl-2-oxobutanoate hydroxymethyltransferase
MKIMEKNSMLTAYDFTMAKLSILLVLMLSLLEIQASNVMAGHKTTLPITLDQMIYHASSVVRAIERSLVVVDLPFEVTNQILKKRCDHL